MTDQQPSYFCQPHDLDEFSRDLLTAAIAVAQRIDSLPQKVEALTSIASIYSCTLEPKDQASELLTQATTTAKSISDPILRATTLANVVGIYQAREDSKTIIHDLLAEALSLVTTIKVPSPEKDEALRQIAFRYALEKQKAQAMKAVDQLSDPFDREFMAKSTLDTITRTQAEEGQHNEALQSIQSATFNPFVGYPLPSEALEQNNAFEKLQQLMDLARRYRDDYGQLERVDAVIEQALQTVNSIKDSSSRLSLQLSLAQSLQELERTEKASELFSQALKILQMNPKIEGSSRRYVLTIAEGFAEAGQVDRAVQLVQSVPNTPNNVSNKIATLTSLGSVFQHQGQPERAIDVLNQAFTLIHQLPDDSDKVNSLVWLAAANIEAERREQAKEILAQVMQFPPNVREDQADTLFYLFEQLGEYDQAFAVAQAAGNKYDLIRLATSYAEKKQYDQAFKVAHAVPSLESQAEAIAEIAVQYTQHGEKDKGFAVMQQAMHLAQTVKPTELDQQEEENHDITFSILHTYMETGEQAQVLQLAQLVQDPIRRNRILFDLVTSPNLAFNEALANAALTPRLEIVKAMSDPQKRAEGLLSVAFQYMDRQQFNQALRIAQEMPNSAEKADTLTGMAIRVADTKYKPDANTLEALHQVLRSLQ
jgi:tetratricopeptide (TPR) repeat protein